MAEILKNNADEVTAKEGSRKSVPVTIVTGFLGSGKTTLLNYILTAKHGKRIAVIENEFGDEIGVESLIAKDGANGEWFDEFFSLGNGCICCSVRDDLVNTLERLLELKSLVTVTHLVLGMVWLWWGLGLAVQLLARASD